MRRGGMVLAFDEAVRTILKLSTEAIQVKEQMLDLVTGMHRGGIFYSEGVRFFKKAFIGHVLDKNHGNQSKAARELGMHRNTLSRTISELQLDLSEYVPERKPIGAHRVSEIQELAKRA